jgi:hypothetical protein
LASAAVIAVGSQALPVYEIYKAGEDLHWKPGLDLLGPYGLPLVFIPHWNNSDGGNELDTRRCFMGRERFDELCRLLPAGQRLVGIDEMTALILDIEAGTGQVMGKGCVTLMQTPNEQTALPGQEQTEVKIFNSGQQFSLEEHCPLYPPAPGAGIPAQAWQHALQAAGDPCPEVEPPPSVLALVEARQELREQKDWAAADRLRDEILELGWSVSDGPEGPRLEPAEGNPGQ